MRIGFFGTPDIAAYCLSKLIDFSEIAFVVTAEDKPSGRKRRIVNNPVKGIALDKGIPIFQPINLIEGSFVDKIKRHEADVYVVVAYGRLLPKEIYTIPHLNTINLHPSLLPKYRGAAPIQWAILNGDTETGITIQLMNERLDAGDILIQKKIPIDKDMTAGDLFNQSLPIGVELIREVIGLLASGISTPIRQKEDEATYCMKIDREIAQINWGRTSMEIHNLVRGLNPKPIAWTNFRGKSIKIWKTRLIDEGIDCNIGLGFLKIYKKRLFTRTGDGYVEILQLQPEAKRVMDGSSFINGYRVIEGDRFDIINV
ncbi:MAG: methionyl-tRNA formyltransferase [Spirochaetota bacterium]|nr:methionyl-tRNA formyltransferase [Spirochaetota bacterium]